MPQSPAVAPVAAVPRPLAPAAPQAPDLMAGRPRHLGAVPDPAVRDGSEHHPPVEPPAWIDEDTRKVWDRLAPVVPEGRLTPATAEAFAHLCVALGTYADAHELITSYGLIQAVGDEIIPNPVIPIRDTQGRTAQTWLKAFGLTPDQPQQQTRPRGIPRRDFTGHTPGHG